MSRSIRAKICVAAILAFFPFAVAGCCGGGSDVKSETTNYSTTLGQELSDLQKAYEQGVITEKQYREAKEKLLKEREKAK
jgi:hypothetical protein